MCHVFLSVRRFPQCYCIRLDSLRGLILISHVVMQDQYAMRVYFRKIVISPIVILYSFVVCFVL